MDEADYIWSGVFLAGTAVEIWALKNSKPGDTLSESTRRWFRVHTKAGAVAFLVAWAVFAVWFGWHILGG